MFALVERDGSMMAKPLERVTRDNIRKAVRDHVHPTAVVHTDDYPLYRFLGKEYAGHHVAKHSAGEYVRGDAYTNTVESYFALLKRAHYGTHHHYAKKHLHRYVDEQSFKWDTRKVTDGERMVRAIEGAEGKRLMYRGPID